jgi:hypothetical protein
MDTDLDVGTADVNMSTGAADLYADAINTDTLMDESVAGVDTIGSTSMDADFSSTGTIGMSDTSADAFFDTPSTTPLSTDDLNTGTRDASFGGETSDLGDALTQWDERTRNEGSGA